MNSNIVHLRTSLIFTLCISECPYDSPGEIIALSTEGKRSVILVLVGVFNNIRAINSPSAYTTSDNGICAEIASFAADVHILLGGAYIGINVEVHIVDGYSLLALTELGIVVLVVEILDSPYECSLATAKVVDGHIGIVLVGGYDGSTSHRRTCIDGPCAFGSLHRHLISLHSVTIDADVIVVASETVHLIVGDGNRSGLLATGFVIEIPMEYGVAVREVKHFNLVGGCVCADDGLDGGIFTRPVSSDVRHRRSFELNIGDTRIESLGVGKDYGSVRLVDKLDGGRCSTFATGNSPREANRGVGYHIAKCHLGFGAIVGECGIASPLTSLVIRILESSS